MNIKSKYYQLDLKYIEYSGTYEGNVIKSIPNGEGTFKSMKNVSYTEYDDEGEEITKQVPAYTYTGEWKDGIKYGIGKLEVYKETEYGSESLIYEGNFKNDFYDGDNGILNENYFYTAYHNYSGSFKSGQFNGFGKLESHGDGEGYSYEGQFIRGEFHGEGIYHVENGMGAYTQKGTFENGYIVYGTRETYQDSEKPLSVYNGSFSNGNEQGNGKIEYFGNLDEDILDWSKNKVKSYEGDWANGEPNGQGTVIYKNGTKITGKFRNGEYVKPFAPSSVKIGNQTWMAENLTVTTFINGDPIPEAKTKAEWEAAGKNGQPAFCYYNNDPATAKTHGVLYNYFAVNDSRGLAPEGWRVPSHEDVKAINRSEFPNLESKIKAINDKEAQGVNVDSERDRLEKEYRTNANTVISLQKFRNQQKSSRNYLGNFTSNTERNVSLSNYLGFWSSSYFNSNEGSAILINWPLDNVVRRVYYYNSGIDNLEYPIRTYSEIKGYGYPVRLIKTN